MTTRLPVQLTATGERHLRAGHPWIYDQSITSLKGKGKAGDLAIIFDRKKNKFLGVGLYDPDSPIRIKALHQGAPRSIDASFFGDRIAEAFSRRAPLLTTDTNGYRLLNGENDGMPSLIVDVYAKVLVVKVYSLIWQPWLKILLPIVLEIAGGETVVLRLSRKVAAAKDKPADWEDGKVVVGELADAEVVFREHGLLFRANVLRGHKTGFFLDHRHNRKRVGELAAKRTVLDVFSYAGGFSVHALSGGARRVTSLDISQPALEVAKGNVSLNFSDARHEILVADAFTALADLDEAGRRFGLVIVDPPSFAKSQSEVDGAIRAYRRLTQLALPLVERGGILLLASCSARVSAEDFFAVQEKELHRSGRRYRELEKTQHDLDHPIGYPEGAYLKSIYYQL